ncbi:MAG: Druantia anti-phage system protein DruA [Candidatus Levyibacteriota bacterium]
MQPLTAPELKEHVLVTLQKQGYKIEGSSFILDNPDREVKRSVHYRAKAERITKSIDFILKNKPLIEQYMIDGSKLDVNKIDPRIIQVKPGTKYETIFKWWNLVWWSLPYEKAYGRQIRYIIWDRHHNAPIGLMGLQSPILSWSVRDEHLGIAAKERDS